jgi:hypothetical protein
MTGLTCPRALRHAALLAICAALALPAGAFAAAVPTYTKESKQTYEAQLDKGQITAATLNKPVRSVRLTLKDGRHALYTYPKKGSKQVEEQLSAKGVPVTQLHGKHKAKQSKTLGSHPRRTIAIIVVVVLIVVGAAFLLWRRRRMPRD